MPGKFKEVRTVVISALRAKAYLFEARTRVDEKNHLQSGLVDEEFVIRILQAARGHQVERRPHHEMPSVQTWIVLSTVAGCRWYLKFYLLEEDTWFISVHPAQS